MRLPSSRKMEPAVAPAVVPATATGSDGAIRARRLSPLSSAGSEAPSAELLSAEVFAEWSGEPSGAGWGSMGASAGGGGACKSTAASLGSTSRSGVLAVAVRALRRASASLSSVEVVTVRGGGACSASAPCSVSELLLEEVVVVVVVVLLLLVVVRSGSALPACRLPPAAKHTHWARALEVVGLVPPAPLRAAALALLPARQVHMGCDQWHESCSSGLEHGRLKRKRSTFTELCRSGTDSGGSADGASPAPALSLGAGDSARGWTGAVMLVGAWAAGDWAEAVADADAAT